MIPILILAAGSSSRMGLRDKLLEPVAGEALLRRVARIACAASEAVLVVLPPGRPGRGQAVAGLPLRRVVAGEAAEGMAASLRAGLREVPQAPGVMVLPADMPELTAEDLSKMIAAFAEDPSRILRGASGERQGHPVIFPADLWPALAALTGDEGGRPVIAANRARLRLIPLPGDHATLDLDTPEDWAEWHRHHR